jgi:LPS-assembly protein
MDGLQYNQPFFWAISESTDATYYGHYMYRRGFKHGLEYRYASGPESKGTAMYDYLYDRRIDDGRTYELSGARYQYEGFRGDNELRLNKKRWWFRMKNDQDLPAEWKAMLDVDVVSDQDYLREFDTGYTGYERTNAYLFEEFERELDDETDTVRRNQLHLNRGFDRYSLNVDFLWYDDVIIRNNNRPDTTQQNLPSVDLTGSKQEISYTPFYFDFESSYDHFWRREGTRGYRADLYPRVYYPISLFKYFDFEPSVGGRETLWQVEQYERKSTKETDELESREIYDFRADLSTEISRIFNVKPTRVDKIRHEIKPRVVYDYVPELEQKDLPSFVGTIGQKRLVTYSLTNSFTARTSEQREPDWETELPAEQEQGALLPKHNYHDFCRIKLSQSYDILEARRDKSGDERRPFSDILGELEFTPYPCVNLDADAAYSRYDHELKTHGAMLTLCDGHGNYGSLDYRYVKDGSASFSAQLFVRPVDPISFCGELEHNLRERKDVILFLELMYQFQCWSLGVTYTNDATLSRREYAFVIGLNGLGEFEAGKYTPIHGGN